MRAVHTTICSKIMTMMDPCTDSEVRSRDGKASRRGCWRAHRPLSPWKGERGLHRCECALLDRRACSWAILCERAPGLAIQPTKVSQRPISTSTPKPARTSGIASTDAAAPRSMSCGTAISTRPRSARNQPNREIRTRPSSPRERSGSPSRAGSYSVVLLPVSRAWRLWPRRAPCRSGTRFRRSTCGAG